MHWWGKSSKKGKRQSFKGCLFDTVHGKRKSVSEKKVDKTSRLHDSDTISEKAVHCSVNYQHPSPLLPVPGCAQVLPQEGHTIATHLADSEIDNTSRVRRYRPSLLCSFARPDYIVDTPDGKNIDMEFMPASVSTHNAGGCDNPSHRHFCTNQVSGSGTTREASSNSPSSSKQNDRSATASKNNSGKSLRLSKSCLNNKSVSMTIKRQSGGPLSASAPNSSVSSPLSTPRRVIRHDPLRNSPVGSGKSHANPSLLSPECSTTPRSRMARAEGDVPELIYRQHSRCSPECSPIMSPRIARDGLRSRVNIGATTTMHQHVAGATTESPRHWSNESKQQSYKLPLPPEKTSSPVPMFPSHSTRTSSHVHRLPSHGSRFKKGRLLGGGTFGLVYLGFDRERGEMCAVKEVTVISNDRKSYEGAQHLKQEIELLSQLNHPNIVQYYGSEMVDDNIYIYLEYVSGGSIYKLLQEYGPLGDVALRNFTKQILSGLAYLHAKNTVHRDVKGANILLHPGGFVKLADFGMAKNITGNTGPMSFKGSPHWIAPEVVKNTNAGVSVDIWSLGCTVLEMATGSPPWGQYEGVAALFKIGNSEELPPIPDSISEEGKDFIRICLQRDPLQRPTAEQLLQHPFVRDLDLEESQVLIPELVEAMRRATNKGNQKNKNPQFLDPVSIHHNRSSRIVSPISNAHSAKNTTYPVSPIGSLFPQSQSLQYTNATRSTPPTLSPRGASGSSFTDPDTGAIQFRYPRTPQHMTERVTRSGIHSSSVPICAGNVMPCHHPQSPKHRCERLCPSPTSSPCSASGRNVLRHPTEPELANRLSQQRLIDHVKFNLR